MERSKTFKKKALRYLLEKGTPDMSSLGGFVSLHIRRIPGILGANLKGPGDIITLLH